MRGRPLEMTTDLGYEILALVVPEFTLGRAGRLRHQINKSRVFKGWKYFVQRSEPVRSSEINARAPIASPASVIGQFTMTTAPESPDFWLGASYKCKILQVRNEKPPEPVSTSNSIHHAWLNFWIYWGPTHVTKVQKSSSGIEASISHSVDDTLQLRFFSISKKNH